MAKTKNAQPRQLEGRVLLGLPQVKDRRVEGFAFEAFDDDLFALGYPHLALLHEDEQDPVVTAEKLVLEGYPYREVVFPRKAAIGLLRAHLEVPPTTLLPTGKAALKEGAAAAIRRTEEFSLAEAGEVVASLSRIGVPAPALDAMLYVVESLVGTRETIEHMLAAVKQFPAANFFRSSQFAATWVTTMAMMLERCPDAEPLRQRATEWAETAGLDATQRAFAGVGALQGESRVEAPFAVVRASRDAVVGARKAAAATPWYSLPDPRLVFLGGDAVYDIELALWPKYGAPYPAAKAHRLMLERFGRIKSPLTVALVCSMAEKSKAKKEAVKWLEQRRDYAVPLFESLASSTTAYAAACRSALQLLG